MKGDDWLSLQENQASEEGSDDERSEQDRREDNKKKQMKYKSYSRKIDTQKTTEPKDYSRKQKKEIVEQKNTSWDKKVECHKRNTSAKWKKVHTGLKKISPDKLSDKQL